MIHHSVSTRLLFRCIKLMMRQLHKEDIYTRADVLTYIGSRFRIKLNLPEWYSDHECANFLFDNYLFPHLDNNTQKFNLLMLDDNIRNSKSF